MQSEKVRTANINSYTNGWFIGDFDPSLLKTKGFEVAHHHYPKGCKTFPHTHHEATEYNYLLSGSIIATGQTLSSGDIFIYEPFEVSEVEFLEDTDLVIIKVPSVQSDKHIANKEPKKNCLLLSGLARNVERGYASLFENVIKPNDPDIFIHAWGEESDAFVINGLFKPKRLVIEPLRKWKNSKMNMDRMMESHAKPYNRDAFVETMYSCWYSAQQANIMKEKYRLVNDINYDYAIRARFDITYSIPIHCSDYDKNVLHLSNRDLPPEMMDDRFAFSSNEIMNASYGAIFNYIDFVHSMRDKKDGIFCGETIIYEMCRMLGINYSKIPNLSCGHIR